MTSWIPITEYAVRNNTSVSTIRRKIKSGKIKHKFKDGKYLIMVSSENLSGSLNTDQTRRIRELEEEIAELKMLVKILEKNLSRYV